MSDEERLRQLKRQVSSVAMKIAGVSGVGMPEQGITVYLEKDTPAVRQRVNDALCKAGIEGQVHFAETGRFHKQ